MRRWSYDTLIYQRVKQETEKSARRSLPPRDSEIDHFVEAAIKEYRLEHMLGDGDDVGLARAKMLSDTREHIVALAVQAKAGAWVFAPASSN